MANKALTNAQKSELTSPTDSGFEEYAGAGLEQVTADDLLVPRLGILQSLSPQLKKSKSEYIEGAEEGQIADLGTGETFPDGIWFLPVYYRKEYLEWAPRDTGKGLVNIHADPAILDQTTRDDKNRPIMPNGNLISETAQFFGLNLSAGRRMCFLPMTSTQLKKARRWNTLAMGEKLKRGDGSEFTAPLFYRTYNLTTAEESNAQGEWAGWKVDRGLALPEINMEDHAMDWKQIKAEALEFLASLIKGEARADVNSMADEDSATEKAM